MTWLHLTTQQAITAVANLFSMPDLTFRGPHIVIYSYNKTKELHQFLKSILGIELCMFWTGFLYIIRNLVLYTQQQVYVIQVMLTASQQAVSITCMYCCLYSTRLVMMDRKPVRNMQSSFPKIDLRNWCISLVLLQESVCLASFHEV